MEHNKMVTFNRDGKVLLVKAFGQETLIDPQSTTIVLKSMVYKSWFSYFLVCDVGQNPVPTLCLGFLIYKKNTDNAIELV